LRAQELPHQLAQRLQEGCIAAPEVDQRRRHGERAEHGAPQEEAAGRVPLQLTGGGVGARQQGQVAEPPGRQADAEQDTERVRRTEGGRDAERGDDGGQQPGPVAPADRRDQDRQRGERIENERKRGPRLRRQQQRRAGTRAQPDGRALQPEPRHHTAVPLGSRSG
jgi:hypothetical protein